MLSIYASFRQIEENILSSTHRNEHVSDTINEKLKRVSGNISDLKVGVV